jgi:hypothetical protein
MAENEQRDMALTKFDQAHAAFAAAVEATPAAALRYRPAGEDYALGGLAIHVAEVLEKYERVLRAMRAADFGPVTEPSAEASEDDAALVRDGFDDGQRQAVLERVRAAHTSLADAVRAFPEDAFRRAAPVTYAGSAEPYPTTPADVLGWVHAHYDEHVVQIADLRDAWAATPQ